MNKTSGLKASEKQLKKISKLRVNAEKKCGAQEFTDWYIKEFAGWLYSE